MRSKTVAIIVLGFVFVVLLGWWVMRASTASETPENIDPEQFARAARSASNPFEDRQPKVEPVALSGVSDAGRNRSASAPSTETGGEAPEVEDGGGSSMNLNELERALAKNAEAAERNVEKYCEQNRKVTKLKAFASPPSRNKDAALYLASRIDWEGGVAGSLHLSNVLTDRMANGAWMTMPASAYTGLDFSWMTELLEYDSWTMSTTGPMRDNEHTNFLEAQIPNFISLQHWSKLRMLKGVHENDLTNAEHEVHHLADLCGSTTILLGEMIRVAIYGIERAFYAKLGLALPADLPSAADAQTYRRTAYAGMYFMWPGVSKAVREKALECSVAKCVALTEGLSVSAGARSMMPEAQETLDWLLKQRQCDPALAEKISRSPVAQPETFAQMFENVPSLDDLLDPDGGSP